jgi:hypothetical protein
MMMSRSRCCIQASISTTLIVAAVVALCVVLPQKALGARGHKHVAGIVITGPQTNISLNTPYTYHVEVVSAKSYKQAAVTLTVPSACSFTNKVNLVAYQPWKKSYTVGFVTTGGMSVEGLGVSVFSPSSSKGSHLLVSKAFPVTPASNPGPAPGSNTVCPKPWWMGS